MRQPFEHLLSGTAAEDGEHSPASVHGLRPVSVQAEDPAAPDSPAAAASQSGADGAAQLPPAPPGFVVEQASVDELVGRLRSLERRIRLQFFGLLLVILAGGWALLDGLLVDNVIVRQKLMESRELTLVDNEGNARLFLRMYSRVPVLQIMDSNGRPRMSMGLRFDDTPFLDLSDRGGRTRATLEMTEDDAPALRLFDENGTPIFNIN